MGITKETKASLHCTDPTVSVTLALGTNLRVTRVQGRSAVINVVLMTDIAAETY